MNNCDICGKKETLPYKCRYCEGYFCSEHRLPEQHDCDGNYWNVPVNVKKNRYTDTRQDKKPSMPNIPFKWGSGRSRKTDDFGFPQPARGLAAYGYNNIIVAICTVLFFSSIIVGERNMVHYLALNPDNLLSMPWQIITSIFLHTDFWHFFWNVFILFFFGSQLESRIGGKNYVTLFLAAGLVGNLGYLGFAYSSGQFVPALGASGGIYGVLGALAIIAPEIRVLLFFIIPMNIRTLIVLFALVDIFGFLASYSFSTGVAHAAHLAGLLVGLYYGKKLKVVRRWRSW